MNEDLEKQTSSLFLKFISFEKCPPRKTSVSQALPKLM